MINRTILLCFSFIVVIDQEMNEKKYFILLISSPQVQTLLYYLVEIVVLFILTWLEYIFKENYLVP